MIDRVGSLLGTLGRVEGANRGAERPGRQGDFEDLIRGAAGLGDADTAASQRTNSSLRLSRVMGLRERGAGDDTTAPRTVIRTPEDTAAESPVETTPVSGNAVDSQEFSTGVAASSGNQFVRSTSATAPQRVRFSSVPESAQYPLGPYHQAPAEFGGEWWMVNPFTGPEPWKALDPATWPTEAATEAEPVPAAFQQVFGPRPEVQDFKNRTQYKTAVAQWEQDLSYFKQSGIPDGFDESQVEAASEQFEAWGMGKPVFYEGRYGWQVRFPDSKLPSFDTTASTAVMVPHIVIAEFQVRSIQEGLTPPEFHPWLPESLRPTHAA